MKLWALRFVVFACCIGTNLFAQGYVWFANRISGRIDARATGYTAPNGYPAPYTAELVLIEVTGGYTPLHPRTSFRGSPGNFVNGYVYPVLVEVPFKQPGDDVKLRMTVLFGDSFVCESYEVSVTLGTRELPAYLDGMQPFGCYLGSFPPPGPLALVDDPSFQRTDFDGTVTFLGMQSSQRPVVGYIPNTVGANPLRRFQVNGESDQTFSGSATLTKVLRGIVLHDDKLLVAGGAADGTYLVTRLNTDGTQDLSFTPITSAQNPQDIAVFEDGRVGVAFGASNSIVNIYSASGAFLKTLVEAPGGIIKAIEPQMDGGFHLGGTFTQINGQATTNLAFINANGDLSPHTSHYPLFALQRISDSLLFVSINGYLDQRLAVSGQKGTRARSSKVAFEWLVGSDILGNGSSSPYQRIYINGEYKGTIPGGAIFWVGENSQAVYVIQAGTRLVRFTAKSPATPSISTRLKPPVFSGTNVLLEFNIDLFTTDMQFERSTNLLDWFVIPTKNWDQRATQGAVFYRLRLPHPLENP